MYIHAILAEISVQYYIIADEKAELRAALVERRQERQQRH